jgi:hypothetical protein
MLCVNAQDRFGATRAVRAAKVERPVSVQLRAVRGGTRGRAKRVESRHRDTSLGVPAALRLPTLRCYESRHTSPWDGEPRLRFSIFVSMERLTPGDDMNAVAKHASDLVKLAEEGGFEIA